MTIQTTSGAMRRMFSLPHGGANTHTNTTGTQQYCSSPLSKIELRQLVAAMVD